MAAKAPKGDINQIKFICLATTLLLVANRAHAAVALGSAETNELYESAHNSVSRGQQQQVIANDLVELQPEVAAAQPEQQGVESRRQQQQPQSQSQQNLVSQGVINGNYAIYVEPPADFKPIIYDYDKHARSTANQQHQHNKNANRFDSPNQSNPPSALSASASGSQIAASAAEEQQSAQRPLFASPPPQQQGFDSSAGDISVYRPSVSHATQQQQQQSMIGNSNQEDSSESSQSEPTSSSSELKPSIGRWSDWHDMSIEPDLASSDSLSTGYLAANQQQQQQRYYVVPLAPFRTRYRPSSSGDFAPSSQGSKGWNMQPQVNSNNNGQSLLSANIRPAQLFMQQPRFYVKGGQQVEFGPASGTGPKLALNLMSLTNMQQEQPRWQHQYKNENGLDNQHAASLWDHHQLLQAQQQQQQQLVASKQLSGSQHAITTTDTLKPTKQQQQQQRRTKRRRKSKSNAEVRIQQLVTASQLQQLQRIQMQEASQASIGKQVNGLNAANHNQQQLQQLQVNGDQQRVLSATKQARLLPSVVVRRLNGGSGHESQHQHQQITNVTAAGAAKPKVIKRRRIKTQLPVGLSSWFLGGIRDLDGKHWQLPAEVVNRLAVNDVDLHHDQTPAKVEPHSAGSVILLANEASATPTPLVPTQPASGISTHRVPISQLVPR